VRVECPYCGRPAVTRLRKLVLMFRPTTCTECGRRVGVSALVALAYIPAVVACLAAGSWRFDATDHPLLFAITFVAALAIALTVEVLAPLRAIDPNA